MYVKLSVIQEDLTTFILRILPLFIPASTLNIEVILLTADRLKLEDLLFSSVEETQSLGLIYLKGVHYMQASI